MTAVEWLVENLISKPNFVQRKVIEKAKEMEKEQIMWAHESGIGCIDYGYAEQYYNETFKSNEQE